MEPKRLIVLEISSCKQCPNFSEANPWSSDGWDRMIDWVCKKNGQKIQGAVERHKARTGKNKLHESNPLPLWFFMQRYGNQQSI